MKVVDIDHSTPIQLNWLVAKVLGELQNPCYNDIEYWKNMHRIGSFRYSNDWATGGKIVDQMIQSGATFSKSDFGNGIKCYQIDGDSITFCSGPTTLIAAMRVFVLREMKCFNSSGCVIEVPDELA